MHRINRDAEVYRASALTLARGWLIFPGLLVVAFGRLPFLLSLDQANAIAKDLHKQISTIRSIARCRVHEYLILSGYPHTSNQLAARVGHESMNDVSRAALRNNIRNHYGIVRLDRVLQDM